ncbi:amidohydrolase family protein [Pseudonocardia sp. CA-107938]|uniref:amidohydrolase family protein n=1 Tax=Pseudonocardia sp. CA-107938 TaxID=3240021 RepID=UPI003D92BD3C
MRRLAIRAARLFDGVTCASDPMVLVEDGRITSVQHGATPPPDAELLDLTGATLLPGLIDPHVHLGFDAAPGPIDRLVARSDAEVLETMTVAAAAQLAAGVTTVRDLGDRDYLAVRLREAGATALPTILAAGPPITCPDGHCAAFGTVVAGETALRSAVRERADRGADVVKIMASGGGMTPSTQMHMPQFTCAELAAAVDEAHRVGLPVTVHAHALEAIRNALAAGVDGIEHCSFLTADGVHAAEDVVRELVERQVPVTSPLGQRPIEGAPPPPPVVQRNMGAMQAAMAALFRRGGRVMAGPDAGIAPQKPHGVLPYALVDMVGAGLDPAAVLRANTSVAAEALGLPAKGRVAPGCDADVLAVEGDPISDITALLTPVAVLVGGQRIR